MEIVKFYANERAGAPDFRAATGALVLADQIRHNRGIALPSGRTTGAAATGARILSGFGFLTSPVGAQSATLIRGVGILPFWDEESGDVSHGLLLSDEGASSKILDFSSAGAGTWAVYIRFVYASATFENRVFWDADGAPAAEYVDNVATRRSAQWEAIFQDAAAAPPGSGEYVKIWEVTTNATAGGTVTAIADFRHFFFEGSANSGDGPYDAEWGDGTNDRSADRASYGVTDIQMWAQAVRRQLADIIGDASGAHDWFKVPAIELLSLNVEHYSESESATGTPGHHKQVTVGTLGGGGQRHRFSNIDQDTFALEMVDQPDNPLLVVSADDGGGVSEHLWEPRGTGTALTNSDIFRRKVGGAANADLLEQLTRNAADDYSYQLAFNGTAHITLSGGSAAAAPSTSVAGQLYSAREQRITSAPATEILMVPLQLMSNLTAGGWNYDEVLPAGASRLTITGSASLRYCSAELVLPHNAILSAIRVLWAQDAAGTGAQAGCRLYAKKHRVASNAVGIIGGGTGSPSSIVAIKTAAQYIEHTLSGGGAATPYRRVEEFTCDEAAANRTFDMTQDKLVITLESVDDAARTCSVYWLMVKYNLDYVSPPLA